MFGRLLRWVPFLFIFVGLAMLAEVGILRRSFLSQFGPVAWNRLHFYGSAVLVVAAYMAQAHGRPSWRRLLFAVVLVLAAGLLREVRQYFDVGPSGFSRYDIRSDVMGTVAGMALCMVRYICSRRQIM